MIVVGAALLGTGCVSRASDFGAAGTTDDGDDDTFPPDPDDGPMPPPPDDDGPMPPPPPPDACPTGGELFGDFLSVFGSTVGALSLYDESICAPTYGPDVQYLWEVPYDGEWQIDTYGSDFDTVLALHFDRCSGEEFDCSDDDFDLTSSVRTFLPGGALVTIVVDGFEGESGDYILNISPLDTPPPPPMCLSIDFGWTTGFSSTFDSQIPPQGPPAEDCGGREGPQAIFSFTAAESGRYVFEARGELGEPAIVDFRDDACEPDACMSIIDLDLTAGEFVQFGVEVLDPLSPIGVIDVQRIGMPPPPPPPPPTCPQYDVPFGLPTQQTGAAGAGQDVGIGSCSPQAPASIATFEWTSPAYGDVAFSANVAGTLTGIIVQEASCSGAELGCVVPTGINGGQASITVPVKKGRDYIVTVGTMEPVGTDVTLDVLVP